MNLKERGITVGDLLIIVIITTSTIFFINRAKEGGNQTHFFMAPNYVATFK